MREVVICALIALSITEVPASGHSKTGGKGGRGGYAGVELKNGGYEGVVFAISPNVDEIQADGIIAGIKRMVEAATPILYSATRKRTFFRDVRVLLPKTWTNTPFDEVATTENFDTSPFRVDEPNLAYKNQPYTMQPDGCGQPGLFTHFTPDYLTLNDIGLIWGPPGKLLVHEWAKLRWGVFSEFGFPDDDRFPLFYSWNTFSTEGVIPKVKPTSCANEALKGPFLDVMMTHGSCKYNPDGLPDANCRFVPSSVQKASTSLTSYYYIDNIVNFCDDSEERAHDPTAPTPQNLYCDQRSVWSVMMQHPDFADMDNPQSHPLEAPVFTVVRPADANFALVLDYSGSMGGALDRVTKMERTARRWILNEVGVGSSVGIVGFSDTAEVVRHLTVITENGDERKALAQAVNGRATGGTCIFCGLVMAYSKVLDGRVNAVIMLITDGEETDGHLEDAIPELMKRGIRVVTVAFGDKADPKLENLAEATGGKTYMVFDEEEGNSLNDAFLGALTYQPGASIAESDIKIHQDYYMGTATSYSKSFTVDASVGRNLFLRLESDSNSHVKEGPILLSPNGIIYDNVAFEQLSNVWTLKVDLAEVGIWQWRVSLSGDPNHFVNVDVTAQARDPENHLPIYTRAWVSAAEIDATTQHVIAFAQVYQGNNPVVRARVRAYITTPDPNKPSVEVDLYDNGKDADTVSDDGIYSRFLSMTTIEGRYSVKAQVWSDGQALINNGFLSSRVSRLRHPRSLPVDPLKTTTYCCGSRVPIDLDKATPTGDFTRLSSGGSFSVTKVSPTGDSYPPSQVKDLKVTLLDSNSLSLLWTAPGDDYDQGIVAGYVLRYSLDGTELSESNFDKLNDSSIIDLSASTNNSFFLVEAGIPIVLNVTQDNITFRENEMYFFAFRAFDKVGLKSRISNLARAQLPSETAGGGKGKTSPCWTVVICVLGCLFLFKSW